MQALTLVIFIDALGWEVLKNRKFLEAEMPHRRKLTSVLGYSSACVPSILTGRQPQDHGHWSFFFAANEATTGASPFKGLQWLRFLPFSNRGRVRNKISKWLKGLLGWTGYFQLYNMPFSHIDQFDYCEKRDIFAAEGMNKGGQIFEYCDAHGISYHVSDWHASEPENLQAAKQAFTNDQPEFAFLYLAEMDGLLHQVGKDSEQIDAKLAWYEQELRQVLEVANGQYDNVKVHICSDHGMATVEQDIDLMATIENLPLTFGKEYLAAYDSTMARFWFYTDAARQQIVTALEQCPHGRILDAAELARLGCAFDNQQYGELVFLLDGGKIICPSHMGTKTITGMHGYHPDHPDSNAVLLSNVAPLDNTRGIIDLYALIQHEVACA
ncbi:MAG: alkaline phosphatase family protein [Pseudomonadales bacterium]|nr:alkaline phosphatase family protein [Pseudomonadales bacterium]MDP4640866.1 alkaline phosphatase family protein [Pseudomonadales bacterium]